MSNERVIEYNASATLARFHRDDSFYRVIIGPVGSGKSTGCCFEIMRRAREQAANAEGVRKSRWAVIRNTYGELKDTTVKTWLDWFPEEYFGDFNRGNFDHKIRFADVELEVMFRALDKPKDVAKLLSLELTGAWVNECREVPKAILDTLGDRVGRFPSKREGGCTWRGVICDTNPPDEDHWLYRVAELERPENWAIFRQPGGVIERDGEFISNPAAENIENLEPDYYMARLPGKNPDYIRVYYASQYGFVREGKPVYPEYVDKIHCADEFLAPDPSVPLYVGLDFGLTPAAAFGQRLANGRWVWIDELVTEDMGVSRFADLLGPKLSGEFAGYEIEVYGDPAGRNRAETDEKTAFQILQAKGINARPAADNNDYTRRREAVAVSLGRLIDGKPGLLVSPKCKMLRKAMAGGYCYRRIQVVGDERFHDKPNKDRFSHIAEAAQYMMLGAGEGRAITRGEPKKIQIRVPRPLPRSDGNWMGA